MMRGGVIWWGLFVLSLAVMTSQKCLLHEPDPLMERNLIYNGQSLPIVIESSDRVGQQLISHILKIILEEMLGYSDVEIRSGFNSMNATATLLRLGGCPDFMCYEKERRVPETMVNLEVPAQRLAASLLHREAAPVMDAGPLGTAGRHGWYVPSFFVENNWISTKSIVENWRALLLETVTSQLMSKDKPDKVRRMVRMRHHGGYHGNTQELCPGNQCVPLMYSYQDIGIPTVKSQIYNLGLNVSLELMGAQMHRTVYDRTNRKLPSLFYDWAPNVLTASGNYTRLQFPQCEDPLRDLPDCDFNEQKLTKATWPGISDRAPEAYHVINRMTLHQYNYEDLLRFYGQPGPQDGSSGEYQRVACDWLKYNPAIWKPWLTPGIQGKQPIYLGGMFPISGPYWQQPGIVPGALLALDLINRDRNILPYHEMKLLVRDTQCIPDEVMKQYMFYLLRAPTVVGILGPGCSTAEPMIGVSRHFFTPVVSYSVDATKLSNRQKYPYFFRTIPRISEHGNVYLSLFKHYNWQQVALLAGEEGQEFSQFHSILHDMFTAHGISVVLDRKLPDMLQTEDAAKYLSLIQKSKAKIIIVTSYEMSARAIICQAYRQKMTQKEGYLWFLPSASWFTSSWWDVDHLRSQYKTKFQTDPKEGRNHITEDMLVPCSTAEVLKGAEGHLSLANAFFAADNAHVIGNVTVRKWKSLYKEKLLTSVDERGKQKYGTEVSDWASYAYDAVWVYALALDKLLKKDILYMYDLRVKESKQGRLKHYLSSISFNGVSGPIHFDGADRAGIINVYQFQTNDTYEVGQFMSAPAGSNITGKISLTGQRIRWITHNGRAPDDGKPKPKKCSIEAFRAALGVDCDLAILIANVMGVSAFAVTMIILLVVVKRRYDGKVEATQRRMEELGLLDAGWLSLDEWELPREYVVLNRKLGEGAFGTVYGGEAFVYDSWMAVAVKTLKPGSNIEDKLDFLSEAEMMKRFDHENIVKLLGVCTRGEPAYAVMEFMLHGDLKTFLLSRRHLVGQGGNGIDDVAPKQLTKMSLDIAFGLHYLSELKYVHRDLACRNCLVHANKKVKIGDFGMTRPMYDSDYYRFSKKGMMPVRWMAPESLVDGIFTPQTDIWSYGILLFEMITFGSFPYQGLSNKQVLHYVRSGNTLDIPPQCNKILKAVIRSCWSFNDCDRPVIDDIIRVLEDNDSLLTPCLDAPASAVAMEGMDEVDMEMAPQRLHKLKRTTSRSNSRTFSERGSVSVISAERGSAFSCGYPKNNSNSMLRTQSQRNSEPPNTHNQSSASLPPSISDPYGHVLNIHDDDNANISHVSDASKGDWSPPIIEEINTQTEEKKENVEMETKCHFDLNCTNSNCDNKNCVRVSPKTYIRFVTLSSSCEDKTTDSDYCSDNSREVLHHHHGTNSSKV